eukprot:gnl/TRDRNA2_/TRDRNA2_33733_c0_seq2.p1 gnl/TRDRNA2_/TRDRNA2_33733_c0~~gnl/TRDRNA2_/TRDRNA2_33733_c0_seq2.p1  ORF type:complete len:338 (+),score=32.50 gnl/TRDRNA2_/TRDRNA2_33733_c0_seq2:62-1075(+)
MQVSKQVVYGIAAFVLLAAAARAQTLGRPRPGGSTHSAAVLRRSTSGVPSIRAPHHSDVQLDGLSRRDVLGLLSAVALGSSVAVSTQPALAEDAPSPVKLGLDSNGKLRRCPADSDCLSTTSADPYQYRPAWFSPDFTPEDAVSEIKNAVDYVCADALKGVEIAAETEAPNGGRYIRFLVKGVLGGVDALEFLVKRVREQVALPKDDNQFEDESFEAAKLVVAWRSIEVSSSPFALPWQRNNLMEGIRKSAAFGLAGCDLEECKVGSRESIQTAVMSTQSSIVTRRLGSNRLVGARTSVHVINISAVLLFGLFASISILYAVTAFRCFASPASLLTA